MFVIFQEIILFYRFKLIFYFAFRQWENSAADVIGCGGGGGGGESSKFAT